MRPRSTFQISMRRTRQKGRKVALVSMSKGAGCNRALYEDDLPMLEQTKVAIIGLDDKNAGEVREALYQLSFPFNGLEIADLGNIRKKDNSFIISILQELLQSNIVPIIIGGQNQNIWSQFLSYQYTNQAVQPVLVSQNLAFSIEDNADLLINKLKNRSKIELFHLCLMGLQMHYADPDALAILNNHHFDCLRLGKIRDSISNMEPFIRDAEMMCFELNAIRHADCPAQENGGPSGLFIEEACQLARYAGMSDKLSSFGLYGLEREHSMVKESAQSAALLIWYFLDGVYNRKMDYPVSMNALTEYVVSNKEIPSITFWKSNKSGRWWVQVPASYLKTKEKKVFLIPCSYDDYLQAVNEELPDRYWLAFERYKV